MDVALIQEPWVYGDQIRGLFIYFVLEIITEWYWTRPKSKQYKNYSKSKQTRKSDIITYMYRTTQGPD